MSKDWRAYAVHTLESVAKLERIQARGDLVADEILYDAALRNLQTLAEATRRLPDDLKVRHPEIDWKNIAAFRNILVTIISAKLMPSQFYTLYKRIFRHWLQP